MTADHPLSAQQQELSCLGFRVLEVMPDTIIAARRTFNWECLLTWVNYTVFVRRVPLLNAQVMATDQLTLMQQAQKANQSPLPRGFQSGNAVLVAYIADQVDLEARQLCQRKTKIRFAQFYVPAALDQDRQIYLIQKTPLWGFIYYVKFRYILNRLLKPEGTPNQEPRSTAGMILTGVFGVYMVFLVLFLVSILS
ncbi:hypothetical protein [Acaryochloris sp. IP29b_bin.148]|uniref:hypothetical protein n=1 Tax=Acaryochloris sp. IP29b_bin.148 TaxID=2969218 RepID=UPI0026153C0F|nr:hypothetical protein [Acaryochloris sp. IP29b_bin.148]